MARMIERTCACGCGRKFLAMEADVKRGWGKYFSKSCKAIAQERRTHQYARFQNSIEDDDMVGVGQLFCSGVFGHGQE